MAIQPENESMETRPSTDRPSGNKLLKWLASLGPGIITAALVFGPSKITITSKMGAEYGYSLLWIVVVAIFFMAVFTAMAARIGLATQQSFLSTIRERWGNGASIGLGIGVFLVTTSFQAGNSIGVGIALAEATQTSTKPWIILFNVIAIGLLFFRTFYKVLEKLMITLISLMLFAFVITLFLAKPDFAKVAMGFVPSLPTGSRGLTIAFVASTFSIVGALYQSYLVQERRRANPGLVQKSNASRIGIVLLGILSAIVMICGAAILNPQGIKVVSATDMAKALEPLFGHMSSNLFLAGLFGASFSALIGNATLGGTLLGDALGYGSQLNTKTVRGLISLIMIIGAAIALSFGKLPLELIILAQSVTILIVPFIGLAMYVIANDAHIMGQYRNTILTRIVGGLGLLLIIGLAISNVNELFFK
ncbi:Nramp family divalent metal transporter [Spirosoma flavum]|uniref:Nramp family divalent metal transporter n=1 Tax=Spirosoma flavum TaxID=2048557 RepID=A0ABW6AT04_9BACT